MIISIISIYGLEFMKKKGGGGIPRRDELIRNIV